MKVTLTVTAGPAQGQCFTFEQPDLFLFGRAKDARVSLPNDPYVSRHHFLLEIAPPSCRITDLDSKNGTFVDQLRYGGRKAPEPGMQAAPDGATSVLLKDNSEIVVGDTRMNVRLEGTAPANRAALPTLRSEVAAGQAELLTVQETGAAAAPAMPSASLPTQVDAQGAPALAALASGSLPTQKSTDEFHVPPAPAPVAPGIAFPGYRIEKVIGHGGMGIVYKAIDEKNGREVAIKSLLPQVSVSFDSYRAFHREIEVTRQLKHPNIVALFDDGNVKGAYYCVLEFVDGIDLKHLMLQKDRPLSLAEAAPIMLGTLDGLAFAHRVRIQVSAAGAKKEFTGVVHRDLKPENILLAKTPNGWIPKVADFGLAKSFESAGMTDMTMKGVCGTPVYWPREQITHYRYLHPATDVFSIACVFFEILTGNWARPGLTELFERAQRRKMLPQLADFMRVIGTHPIPPLHDVAPAIPIAVAAVIDRALLETEVPNDEAEMRATLQRLRYPDAGVFREELELALKRCGVPLG